MVFTIVRESALPRSFLEDLNVTHLIRDKNRSFTVWSWSTLYIKSFVRYLFQVKFSVINQIYHHRRFTSEHLHIHRQPLNAPQFTISSASSSIELDTNPVPQPSSALLPKATPPLSTLLNLNHGARDQQNNNLFTFSYFVPLNSSPTKCNSLYKSQCHRITLRL